LIHKI